MSFVLDDRLARDTFVIGDLPLCRVLLMNDARWPWLILVPRRCGLVELIDLGSADQTQLMDAAAGVARFLKSYSRADKINVGALGNIVRQLHLHVVARVVGDPAWPGPILHGPAKPYEDTAAQALRGGAKPAASSARDIGRLGIIYIYSVYSCVSRLVNHAATD